MKNKSNGKNVLMRENRRRIKNIVNGCVGRRGTVHDTKITLEKFKDNCK